MAVGRIRPSIGRKRIDKFVNTSEKSAAADIRAWTVDVRKLLTDFLVDIDVAIPAIMVEALRPTFEKSQVLVPVKTGVLKASGFLRESTFRGVPGAEIGYADGGRPFYAAKVHEDLDVFHKPPTQAKFLEQPLLEDIDNIKNRVIFLIKEMVNG